MNMKRTLGVFLLALLYMEVVMPLQHVTSEKKWELLLKTIGAKEVEVISVTDDKIVIKTDIEHIKYLRKLLDSKETLQKNTLHALLCDNRRSVRKSAIGIYDIKDNNWFKRVVSDEFIKENNLTEVFDAMQSNVHFDEELLTIELQFTLPSIMSYLRFRINLSKLQYAISDEKALAKILAGKEPPVSAHSNTSPTKFAQVVSKIIPHEENFTVNFIINNGAFAQTLQAYKVDGETPIIASDLNGLFIIDKQYLLEYLTPIFNGLVWSEDGKIPIVFHAKRPESGSNSSEPTLSSHDINTLIDTSGSMQPNFDTYQRNIKEILDKVDNIPNWQIQMVRFSSDSTKKFFSLKNGDTINDVKNYVDTFVASGSTRLYCTVKEALIDIASKLANTLDLYSTLMVFTDGDNNVGSCTEDDVINAAAYLKTVPQFNMYGIGFGATESGFQRFFKRLAEVGGFIHVKLDDPNGMTQLQQYIDLLTQKINIWEILQGELNMSVSRVPEGDAFMLDPVSKSQIEGITIVKNGKEKFKIGTEAVNCASS